MEKKFGDVNIDQEMARIRAVTGHSIKDPSKENDYRSNTSQHEENKKVTGDSIKNKEVKISIIVPVFKTEKYLRKCLDSILFQTMNDIEILVVNSSSPDGSQTIIDEYVKKFPNLIIPLFQKDRGLGDSRNFGLKFARGKYVMFIDSDDTFSNSSSCERLFSFAEKNGCDIVIGRMVYDYNGVLKEIFGFENKYKPFYNRTDLRQYSETGFGSAPVMNKIYKRELLMKYGIKFPKYRLYEDILFCIEAWYYSKKIGCIDSVVYHYTQRIDPTNPSITQTIKFRNVDDRIYAAYSIKKFLWKVGLFDNNGFKYLSWLRKSIGEMPDKISDESEKRKAMRKWKRFSHSYSKVLLKYQQKI